MKTEKKIPGDPTPPSDQAVRQRFITEVDRNFSVIAPAGVNVRTGPGTAYPILGAADFNVEGAIIGRALYDGRIEPKAALAAAA